MSRRSINEDPKSESNLKSESTITFKVSEWPSNHVLNPPKNNEKSKCFCFNKNSKLSVIEGKHRPNHLSDTAIIDYFVNQIEASDGKINASHPALITLAKTFSYQEIHDRSDKIAEILKSRLTGKETKNPDGDFVIGMAFPGRDRKILVQLAILKTGCCYLPIDCVNFPTNRIFNMVNLIKPLLIISTDNFDSKEKLEGLRTSEICEIVSIEELWEEFESKNPDSKVLDRKSLLLCEDYIYRPIAIYIKYGSNGPQGIRIVNKALWNRVIWEWETFPYEKHEKLVLQSHIWEIQSIGELFTPLLAGFPILITDRLHVERLLQDIRDHKVTRLAVFPSFLTCLLTTVDLYKQSSADSTYQPLLTHVKLWFCYRASLRVETATKFFKNVTAGTKLVQIHGALETLQVASYQVFDSPKSFKDLAFYQVLPAGTAISNMNLYITDDEDNLLKQGCMGEICISGVQMPCGITGSCELQRIHPNSSSCAEFVANPFFKNGQDEAHKALLKSGDYGRIFQESCLSSPILIFDGRAETQFVMNNQRINIKEILRYLKAIKGVKGCHALAYRPTTCDQTVLAFAVTSRRNPVSMSEILEKLREDLPEYMMPNLVIVEGIPVGKDFEVNQAALIEAYFKDREDRMTFDECFKLGFDTPEKLKAAKVIFDIMFTLTRISKRAISESMNESIFKIRARFSNLPSILSSLWRCGYKISFDQIVEIQSVRELIETMASSREAIGDGQRLLWLEAYKVERINPKIRHEIFELLCNISSNMRGSGILFYYSEIKKKHLNTFFKPFWELLMVESLSVLARRVKDHKLSGALLNVGIADRKAWKAASGPMKYSLEFIQHFDKILQDRGHIFEDLLQTVLIVADTNSFENYDEAVSILDKLFQETLKLAETNGFNSYTIISFDYAITITAVDLFDFELVSSMQINSFVAQDETKPFKLAPDYVVATCLVKSL